ncbi:ABC transporter ATP-binding protein [Macrococcus capreoli]|uniref:ABC transporter ATP-binding protein n=1 Tax=Macrococcus capreoli TaxID=2982690 RepID=UPI0021D5F8C6|nr:ABC transporter ATP-binding protein [Macrococcus sp. TMW 2.2395]MCU7556917.1 ABC transporter ATP-binding protein [Macrococcus sp. TMW 2.2395]
MIQVTDLTKTFKQGDTEVTVLNNINLEVKPGEVVCLYGPSGSGKSTLLTIIGALLKPTSGDVRINNQSITALNQQQLTQLRLSEIGFIFQASHLVPFLKVKEQLMHVALENQMDKKQASERAETLLSTFGLSHRTKQYPKSLSGGEKQRVAIARAFMNKPSLILADEPTASLDFERAVQVIEAIQERVKAQQSACIIITHDDRIFKYADHLYRLEGGKMVKER